MMRVGRVEQVFEGEEVDVIQRDEEGGAPAPHEDEDRQDRVCPRGSRLRRLGETRGPSTFRAGLAALSCILNNVLGPAEDQKPRATDGAVHLRVQLDAGDRSATVSYRTSDSFRNSVTHLGSPFSEPASCGVGGTS